MLRDKHLASVCEEAACPNLGECFGCGTATFMIMGSSCTRNCRFCNVTHGHPQPLDPDEPRKLAEVVANMKLKYVVITSVTRDDLGDGGADHFRLCIEEVRKLNPGTKIEILTPDFRLCMELALKILSVSPPDVFNHNIETVPSLYQKVRPSADYLTSLTLLQKFREICSQVPTKSGMMLGLGETREEVEATLHDLRKYGVEMLTLGQYLRPREENLPVSRYVTPQEFADLAKLARNIGFVHVASGPMVRSSYHADRQITEL
jgi:lipoic acid synthetase